MPALPQPDHSNSAEPSGSPAKQAAQRETENISFEDGVKVLGEFRLSVFDKHGEADRVFRQMKPGLTGYWQIHGRQRVPYAQRVEMDLFYVKNRSLWPDLKILITPIRVLRGEGAH